MRKIFLLMAAGMLLLAGCDGMAEKTEPVAETAALTDADVPADATAADSMTADTDTTAAESATGDADANPPLVASAAYLRVTATAAGTAARTALPTFTEDAVVAFPCTLTGKKDGEATASLTQSYQSLTALTQAAIPVDTGTWDFVLAATKDGTTFTGTLDGTEIMAGDNTLAFTVAWDESDLGGNGSLSFTLDWSAADEKAGVAAATGELLNYNVTTGAESANTNYPATALTVSGNKATYTLTGVSAGVYQIKISLWADAAKTVLINTWRELAVITGGQQSAAERRMASVNKVYTITYNKNGGDFPAGTTAQEKFTRTSAEITLPSPERTGYAFGGWYASVALTGDKTEKIPAKTTKNKAFWAKWVSAGATVRVDTAANDLALTATADGTKVTLTATGASGTHVWKIYDGDELLDTKTTDTGTLKLETSSYGTGTYTVQVTSGTRSATAAVSVLSIEGFAFVAGTTIAGTESWTPVSKVFVSGRSLTIGDLYVSDHEVTQAEYEAYCKYGSSSPSDSYGKGDNFPVYFVNWYDAVVYCNLRSKAENLTPVYAINGETDPTKWSGIVGDAGSKYCGPSSSNDTWNGITMVGSGDGTITTANGYRLPTEAEWEYIARGANESTTAYSGSDTVGDVAWYSDNSENKTHEVKTKAPNALGINDMSGNVWEWCWDWFSSSISAETAATGSASGVSRVLRGGSWLNPAGSCAVSYRGSGKPYNGSGCGFRVVRNAN